MLSKVTVNALYKLHYINYVNYITCCAVMMCFHCRRDPATVGWVERGSDCQSQNHVRDWRWCAVFAWAWRSWSRYYRSHAWYLHTSASYAFKGHSINYETYLTLPYLTYKAVDDCEAVDRRLWSLSRLWSRNQHKSTGNVQQICSHEFGQLLVSSLPPDFRNLSGHRCKAPPPRQGGWPRWGRLSISDWKIFISYYFILST